MTTTRWKVEYRTGDFYHKVMTDDSNVFLIARTRDADTAAQIVAEHNSFEDLKDALQNCVHQLRLPYKDRIDYAEVLYKAETALRLAKGEPVEAR